MDALLTLQPALQLGIFNSLIGKVFLVLLGLAIVILVGRFVLSIAWRLVTIAAVIVGILLLLSVFGLLP